jgi:GNAT superfamily N-acetyltransferase
VSEAAGGVVIRPARPGDVERIYELIIELATYERSADHVESSAEDLRAALCAPEPALFGHVAVTGEQIVGFALWFVNYSTWSGKHGIYLEDLYVRPEMRGQGTGKALLATLASICVQRGYRRLEWWVLDWNTPAIGFYESLGAIAMSEWTVHRLTGPPLADLAELAADGG